MEKPKFPVVYVAVKNLVVVNREISTDDKPAGAGKLKSVFARFFYSLIPFFVSEVVKWISHFDIS